MEIKSNHNFTFDRNSKHQEHDKRQPQEEDLPYLSMKGRLRGESAGGKVPLADLPFN